jgi:hypothetical protein
VALVWVLTTAHGNYYGDESRQTYDHRPAYILPTDELEATGRRNYGAFKNVRVFDDEAPPPWNEPRVVHEREIEVHNEAHVQALKRSLGEAEFSHVWVRGAAVALDAARKHDEDDMSDGESSSCDSEEIADHLDDRLYPLLQQYSLDNAAALSELVVQQGGKFEAGRERTSTYEFLKTLDGARFREFIDGQVAPALAVLAEEDHKVQGAAYDVLRVFQRIADDPSAFFDENIAAEMVRLRAGSGSGPGPEEKLSKFFADYVDPELEHLDEWLLGASGENQAENIERIIAAFSPRIEGSPNLWAEMEVREDFCKPPSTKTDGGRSPPDQRYYLSEYNWGDDKFYPSVLACFEPQQWLDDKAIYLGMKFLENDSTAKWLLLDPAVYAFLMSQCDFDTEPDDPSPEPSEAEEPGAATVHALEAYLKTIFDRVDSDGSGSISAQEALAALKEDDDFAEVLGARSKGDVLAAIEGIDTDEDNKMSWDGFRRAALGEDEVALLLRGLVFPGDERVLATVVSDGSGLDGISSHWSLLVYDVDRGIAKHYDSLGRSKNEKHARECAEKLRICFERPSVTFENVETPRQDNAYDCGSTSSRFYVV